MGMKNYLKLAAVAAALVVWLGAPAPGRSEVVDRIVAIVNDDIITLSEVNAMAQGIQADASRKPTDPAALRRQVLDVLIERKLARAEAKRMEIKISDAEVDKALNDFKKSNHIPDDAALSQALAKEGHTLKEFRQQLVEHLQQERLVQMVVSSKSISVSEAEIRRYYDEHVKDAVTGGSRQVHLKVISLQLPKDATPAQKAEVERQAKKALDDINGGMSFDVVMAQFPKSSVDMGFISAEDLDPQLQRVLSNMRPGQVAPVQSQAGFQLIQMKETRSTPKEAIPYEQAKPRIQQILTNMEMEKKFSQWVKGLRERSSVKVML
jgi:peptidyl-prolyl cis-trans isomerase SurA